MGNNSGHHASILSAINADANSHDLIQGFKPLRSLIQEKVFKRRTPTLALLRSRIEGMSYTCSFLLKEENLQIMFDFLQQNPAFFPSKKLVFDDNNNLNFIESLDGSNRQNIYHMNADDGDAREALHWCFMLNALVNYTNGQRVKKAIDAFFMIADMQFEQYTSLNINYFEQYVPNMCTSFRSLWQVADLTVLANTVFDHLMELQAWDTLGRVDNTGRARACFVRRLISISEILTNVPEQEPTRIVYPEWNIAESTGLPYSETGFVDVNVLPMQYFGAFPNVVEWSKTTVCQSSVNNMTPAKIIAICLRNMNFDGYDFSDPDFVPYEEPDTDN